jgi:hypothetical protein
MERRTYGDCFGAPVEGRVACLVCGALKHNLGAHLRVHSLTGQAYRQLFPGAPLVSENFAGIVRDRAIDPCRTVPDGRRPNRWLVLYWTAERIIRAIHSWAKLHGGEPPKYNDWSRATDAHPARITVVERFGSWNAAIAAAGLEPNPKHVSQKPHARCKRGHPLVPENLKIGPHGRQCRICMNAAVRRRDRQRRKEGLTRDDRFVCSLCETTLRGGKGQFRKHVAARHQRSLEDLDAIWTHMRAIRAEEQLKVPVERAVHSA